MALTKSVYNDKIEIVNLPGGYSAVQVRTVTAIMEDGEEINRTLHRRVIMPDADIAGEQADVQSICKVVFTADVKRKYAAYLANAA